MAQGQLQEDAFSVISYWRCLLGVAGPVRIASANVTGADAVEVDETVAVRGVVIRVLMSPAAGFVVAGVELESDFELACY